MPGTIPPNPARALVVKLGHIGDVLVTSPAISALKQAWPGISITAVVNQGTEDMLRHNPQVDDLLVLRRDLKGPWAEVRFQAGLLRALRRARFDLALEMSGGDRGATLCFASGARWRVGFAAKQPHMREKAFDHLVDRQSTTRHVVETFLDQVRSLGVDLPAPGMSFHPGAEAEARADELLDANGLAKGGFVLAHPTSRWMFKAWTPEGNARIMAHMAAKGLPVVMTAAPVDKEMTLAAEIKQALPPDMPLVDLCGRLDLCTLGALIGRARLFFGVDSAPMHMAAALGTPSVVLFGPSGEKMWGPWQAPSRVVTMDCDCRPCGRDGCQGSKISRCLTELDPAGVEAAVDELLGEG